MEILKVSFRDIKDIQIISFKELPEERQTLHFTHGEEMGFLRMMAHLIKISLIDPKRWEEFASLSLEDFLEFFTKWVDLSEERAKDNEKLN
jgi:hypothetical protein